MDKFEGLFPHRNLNPESFGIRLITLQPAGFDQPIKCFAQRAKLNSCPEYEALSYVAGDLTKSLPITLDGATFQVTANLEAALRHLRQVDKVRVLWVDVFGVNGKDLLEKSRQELRIPEIYRNAKKVLVWLGKEDDDLQDGVDQREEGRKSSVREAFTFAAWTAMFLAGHRRTPFKSEEVFMSREEGKAFFRLQNLMRRKWFERTWSFQEVAVAREVDIVCGSRKMDWDTVCKVPLCFRTATDNPLDHDLFLAPFAALEAIQLCRKESIWTCYNYWSLQEKHWFRLFILEPSPNPDTKISASLLHRPMSEGRSYEALSYTWGDEPPEMPIFIDGSMFLVRRNLYCALKQLRHASEPRALWIDAICINQTDIDERSYQVSQMGEIYTNAKEVAVWLGEGDNNSDLAMDYLKEILTIVVQQMRSGEELSGRAMANYFTSLLTKPDSDTCLYVLAELLLRPWWDRVWTVQEIVLARSAKVYCGSKSYGWTYFEALSKFFALPDVFDSLGSRLVTSKVGLTAVTILRERMPRPSTIKRIRELRATEGITLSFMVKRTINHLATDPRDKIYAMLGVVTRGSMQEPNYKFSVGKVYTAAFKAILEQDRDLNSFNFIGAGIESRQEGLPSWVPDLTANRKLLPISQAFDERVGRVYHASSPNGSASEISIAFQEDDKILVLKGIAVDTISCLGDAAPDPRFQTIKNNDHSLKPVISQWLSLVDCQSKYITGCTTLEAFWRTVTLDQRVQGYHPGYNLHSRGKERRLGSVDDLIPPRSPQAEQRLVTTLDSQSGGIGGSQFNRKFFTTTRGYMGLTSPAAREGDIVCILIGGEVPYVLRPADCTYRILGECYLHGIMDGEVIEGVEKGAYAYQTFALE